MDKARDLTEIELAVVAMLAKPSAIPAEDLQAAFVVRAFADPSDLIQAVFNAVDWRAINENMEAQQWKR